MRCRGGFLEVLPDKVTILADAAERAEDIDEARAEEARKKAQELLSQNVGNEEARHGARARHACDSRSRRSGAAVTGHSPPAQ